MKKLIVVFIGVVLFGMGTFAQTAEFKGSADSFQATVAEGLFEVKMPESTEVSEVERTSAYYTNYFTVEYDADTKIAVVQMVDNTPDNRRVINRFLLSNGVKDISFDGSNYSINQFYTQFMIQQ